MLPPRPELLLEAGKLLRMLVYVYNMNNTALFAAPCAGHSLNSCTQQPCPARWVPSLMESPHSQHTKALRPFPSLQG